MDPVNDRQDDQSRAISDVLNSLNVTPEELEILRNRLRVNNSRICGSSEYFGIGYNGNSIWEVNYKDNKLVSIEMCELPKISYYSFKDITIITVLVNLTTVALTAYVRDERDVIALKGIEHLLYNKSVFRVISNCETANYPNIGLKCFILIENYVLLDENRLFNPIFTFILHSYEICSRTTGLYSRNILLANEKVFPNIKEKNLDSVTIYPGNLDKSVGKEDKITAKYVAKENLANGAFKELTLSKVMKKLQRLDPPQMKSARR